MKRKYTYQYFGKKDNRIKFYFLKKPNRDGFVGMIQSFLFIEPIGLIASDEQLKKLEGIYALLATGKELKAPRIVLERKIYYDFRRGNNKAKTIIFHEIGHFVNKDLSNLSKRYEEERIKKAEKDDVLEMEIKADIFACSILGKENVISGLNELKKDIESNVEIDNLAVNEISNRIKKINDLY